MSSSVAEAARRLLAAVETVDELRVYRAPGANVDPPAGFVGPPRLQWETGCPEPTTATFVVIVMVASNERVLEQLWELVPRVSEAVDELLPEAAVTTALPNMFTTGNGTELPSYEITVEVSL
ncbi:hypothetical protein B0I33_104499 [Prauserella shujinwangii]|uniref:Uncharacterized protein n=1 Tax=Prauserella shujinwangii TaxID=1453103 RepID=A0A2T0LXC3_9PSEU|nr:hypothetical protein [Prauserella shujinwangii]PRX48681.1 hypothetical protein B0I33_104499 [Prauserella shujinwangii]